MEKEKKGKYKGGRPKSEFRTASRENYKRFLIENPTIQLSFKEYEHAIREINNQFSLYCLETGKVVKLPYGLGGLTINKKKGQKIYKDERGSHICLPINWNETNKEGKVIYHFNEHTDGYRCKWYWIKSISRLKIMSIWSFKICKKNSLLLKDFCTSTTEKYYFRYHEYNLKKNFYK